MKATKSELGASVDRFVADIAAIIRRHAERMVADALERRGLTPASLRGQGTRRPSARTRLEPKPKSKAKLEAEATQTKPASSRRGPEQLSLF